VSDSKDKSNPDAGKLAWKRNPVGNTWHPIEDLDNENEMRAALYTALSPSSRSGSPIGHTWVLCLVQRGAGGARKVQCGVYERGLTMQDLVRAGAVDVAQMVESLRSHSDEIAVLLWDGTDSPPKWHRSIKLANSRKST
jgi:hypothetical protein